MSEQPQQPQGRFEIQIPPEVEPGVHADFVSLWHTSDTFVLDFASLRRPPELRVEDDTGRQIVMHMTRVVSRIKIPPSQVFELMKALEKQLTMWEQETGQRPSGGDVGPSER